MRSIALINVLLILLAGCNSSDPSSRTSDVREAASLPENAKPAADTSATQLNDTISYSNERFRNVTVTPLEENKFQLRGEAQIFEASFSWSLEDGHNILQEGHAMTSAGAPDWGKFDFTIVANKDRANSTLHIILYEGSPKDGSRTHELPIPLP